MKLAANLSWLYTEYDFLERLQACAQDGFKYAECMFPYEYPAELLREKAEVAGIEWVLINAPAGNWTQGDRGLAADPAKRNEFKHAVEQAASYAQTLGVNKVHVLAGVVDLSCTDALVSALGCFEDNLNWLADSMKALPIDWLIEPINRGDVPGYLLAEQAAAHNIIKRLNKPNLGVQMDLYHCQKVEGDAVAALAQYLPTGRVKHLQIAGVPNRDEPALHSAGLNYQQVWQQLQSLGYAGHVGCEYRPKTTTRDGLDWIPNTGFSGTMEAFKP